MKLVSFTHRGREGFGALQADGVTDLTTPDAPTLKAALAQEGLAGLQRRAAQQGDRLPVSELAWLPPIPQPGKILCVGLNYRAHILESGAELPAHPSLFVRFPDSLVGQGQPMWRPKVSKAYDFEGELAVVIGKAGRHVSAEAALDHVAGYSCLAENSVRDYQRHAAQVTPGKTFERSGAFGPCLVTADEVPDPKALVLTTRLNGAEMQRSSVADLVFGVPDLIAYISGFTRLEPGDVIATGTPSGVGAARKPPVWMAPGDVLEIEISRVGVLRNPVVDEPEPHS